jgi:hypothetical protein
VGASIRPGTGNVDAPGTAPLGTPSEAGERRPGERILADRALAQARLRGFLRDPVRGKEAAKAVVLLGVSAEEGRALAQAFPGEAWLQLEWALVDPEGERDAALAALSRAAPGNALADYLRAARRAALGDAPGTLQALLDAESRPSFDLLCTQAVEAAGTVLSLEPRGGGAALDRVHGFLGERGSAAVVLRELVEALPAIGEALETSEPQAPYVVRQLGWRLAARMQGGASLDAKRQGILAECFLRRVAPDEGSVGTALNAERLRLLEAELERLRQCREFWTVRWASWCGSAANGQMRTHWERVERLGEEAALRGTLGIPGERAR